MAVGVKGALVAVDWWAVTAVRATGEPSSVPPGPAGVGPLQGVAVSVGPQTRKVTVPLGATSPAAPVTVAVSLSGFPRTMEGEPGAVVSEEPVAPTVKHSSVVEASEAGG